MQLAASLLLVSPLRPVLLCRGSANGNVRLKRRSVSCAGAGRFLTENTRLFRDNTCVYLCSFLCVARCERGHAMLQVAAAVIAAAAAAAAAAAVLLLHVTQTFSCLFASHPAQSRSLPAALSLSRTPPTWQPNHKKIKGGAFFAMKMAFCKAGCRPGSLA